MMTLPLEDQVHHMYRSNPQLIVDLLHRLGATDVRLRHKEVTSTCPIHKGDKSTGFIVYFNRDAPVWRCWTQCADGGPLAVLPMRVFGCSLPDSLSWLASLTNMALPDAPAGPTLFDIMYRSAADEFSESADVPYYFPEEMVAQSLQMTHDHYRKLGFTDDVLRVFQVGFVPAKTWIWTDVDTQKPTGWWVDRISTPVRQPDGRLIGFTGRRVDNNKDRKWQILPRTKRNLAWYGLEQRRTQVAIRRLRQVVMVEGMSDVWRAWMHGVYNVISSFGTSVATSQIDLLQSQHFHMDEIILMFDGDDAGREAVDRTVQKLKGVVGMIRIASLPSGVDPGDICESNVFRDVLSQSRPV